MMDDNNRFGPPEGPPEEIETPASATPEPTAIPEPPAAPLSAQTPAPTPESTAVLKFKSCRWRCDPEDGAFCTHRDVLPYAGKEGFSAESWCPECQYYKLRRTPKKRERVDYTY